MSNSCFAQSGASNLSPFTPLGQTLLAAVQGADHTRLFFSPLKPVPVKRKPYRVLFTTPTSKLMLRVNA